MSEKKKIKMSDLIGELSKQGAEEICAHMSELRAEWEDRFPSNIDWNFSDIERRHVEEVKSAMEDTIVARLKMLGIEVDVEKEKARRFKSFVIEQSPHGRTVWYNDGSITGLRVLTEKRERVIENREIKIIITYN